MATHLDDLQQDISLVQSNLMMEQPLTGAASADTGGITFGLDILRRIRWQLKEEISQDLEIVVNWELEWEKMMVLMMKVLQE